MEGFEKINLDTPPSSSIGKTSLGKQDFATSQPMTRRKKLPFKLTSQNSLIIAGVIVLLVLFGIFGVFLPAKKTYTQAKVTQADAQAALYGLKTENIQIASDELTKTQADLALTQKDLQGMVYLKFIP